jgi:hypothetical protein
VRQVLEVMWDEDVALCLTPQAFSNVRSSGDLFNNINLQVVALVRACVCVWGGVVCVYVYVRMRMRMRMRMYMCMCMCPACNHTPLAPNHHHHCCHHTRSSSSMSCPAVMRWATAAAPAPTSV